MSKPKIIGGATSRTMRAHWAAHEVGLDYDYELIGSRTGATQKPEFLRLNPKEKIPVLVHDDLVLTESAAIMNYLARLGAAQTASPVNALVPDELALQARYEEWQSFILMELDAQTLYIMRKHRDLPQFYGEAPVAVTAAIDGFNKQIRVAETRLSSHEYLVGDAFSGVDILLTTCLEWARAYGFELHESLVAYLRRIRARPAYESARELNFSISPGA